MKQPNLLGRLIYHPTTLLVVSLLFPFVLILLPALQKGAVAQATDPSSKLFTETGKSVRGSFLAYWEQNGGLARHGFPITEQFQEKSDTDGKEYSVQYFERSVFELHPENQPPYDVLLQLLGNFQYDEQYPTSGAAKQHPNNELGARYFSQTGKSLGGKFLRYWEQNGDLSQFGYPISNEFHEQSQLDGKEYLVQYFERAVFELHPENQPPYDVLLSQLGSLRWETKQNQSNENQKEIPAPEFRAEIPDGQYLPIYPESEIKTVIEDSYAGRIDRLVRYEAPADEEKVRAFYDAVMPQYGWTHRYRIGFTDSSYDWTDPNGVIPWHLTLSLRAVNGGATEGRSLVILDYHRYADLDIKSIPLYPDAQEIVTGSGQGGIDWPPICSDTDPFTSTTYITSATPSNIDRFYKSNLSDLGWFLHQSVGSVDSASGLQLRSEHGVGFERVGNTGIFTVERLGLTIKAQELARNATRVAITVKSCLDRGT
jgi:hypothetical protein